MKKLILLFALGGVIPAMAQEKSSAEMTMPEYPALSIIGSQTSEISKPGDYSALLASVISPMVSNNGTIPANLALEFNPYYFKAEKRTLDDLKKRDVLNSLKRTSKISIASNNVIGSDSLIYSRVGLGYRAFLLDGKLNGIYTENISEADMLSDLTFLMDALRGDSVLVDKTRAKKLLKDIGRNEDSKFGASVYALLSNASLSTPDKVKELQNMRDKIEKNDNSWVKPEVYQRALRRGSFVEIAAAVSIDFAEQKVNNGSLNRWGVWGIYTFRPIKADNFDFSVLARLSNYSLDPTAVFTTSGSFGDAGLNLKWKPIKWLTLSGEYILRYGFNDYAVSTGETAFVNVASGASESKLSLVGVIHVSDQVSATFTYSNINGESSYTQEGIQSLLIGLTAAILPAK